MDAASQNECYGVACKNFCHNRRQGLSLGPWGLSYLGCRCNNGDEVAFSKIAMQIQSILNRWFLFMLGMGSWRGGVPGFFLSGFLVPLHFLCVFSSLGCFCSLVFLLLFLVGLWCLCFMFFELLRGFLLWFWLKMCVCVI